jgi:FAD/FMN-containing dehydrogenase
VVELDELRESLAGSVIDPASSEYDAARRCFNAAMDRRPAVIVRCRVAQDVATAFDFARTHSLEVAVRGGGHNPAGHCVVDGGLVIDLSDMRRVDVDPAAGTARASGGATWLDFDAATQAFGLVTPGGVDRRLRAHARRWDRAPDEPARSDVRQPRGRRAGHSRRLRRACRRG